MTFDLFASGSKSTMALPASVTMYLVPATGHTPGVPAAVFRHLASISSNSGRNARPAR
ncbi:MAG TPA: hypothetical protein VFS00_24900 [Polyangiaceae bacterium]|nr:hypothetical protein [Polyangiaceae bacterium]